MLAPQAITLNQSLLTLLTTITPITLAIEKRNNQAFSINCARKWCRVIKAETNGRIYTVALDRIRISSQVKEVGNVLGPWFQANYIRLA